MECHNERAARSRRHHEKKKKAKAKLEEEQKLAEQRREITNQARNCSRQKTMHLMYVLATRTGNGAF